MNSTWQCKLQYCGQSADEQFAITDTQRHRHGVQTNSLTLNSIDKSITSLQEPMKAVQAIATLMPSQLEQGFQVQSAATRELSADVHQLTLFTSNLGDSITSLPSAIEASSKRTLERFLRTHQKLLDPPSRIGDSLDAMESRLSAQLATLTQTMESRGLVPGRRLCDTPPSVHAETWSIAQSLQKKEPMSSSTLRCPCLVRHPSYHRHGNKARRCRLRLWWLSRFLVVTFQSNRGAGGLSMGASLQLSGVIFEKSPVFRILLSLNSHRWTHVSPQVLEDAAKQIALLYENQRASPGDVDCFGRNALHVGSERDVIGR